MSKNLTIPRPSHAYVGRDKGGCAVVIISDMGDKWTGKQVGKSIASGLTIERVDWQTYRDKVSLEPSFMNCQCKTDAEELQPSLFEAAE